MTLLNSHNQKYLDQKTRKPVYHAEVLANLQRQMGLLPLSDSTRDRWFRRGLFFIGRIGIGGSILVLAASLIWCVLALVDHRSDLTEGNVTLVCVAIFLSLYIVVMQGRQYLTNVYGLLYYPPKVTEVYRQLTAQGMLTTGEIVGVEIAGKITTLHYTFEASKHTVEGRYATSRRVLLSPGDGVTILYLDTLNHIIL